MANTGTKRAQKEPLPCTVSLELFEAWKRLKRNGDPGKMAERFGRSRVPFDNALNYGHVAKDETKHFINEFFQDRLNDEKSQAESLNELSSEVASLTNGTATK